MGYRRKKTVMNLKFEEHEGLEVRVRALTIDELLEMTKTAQTVMGKDGKVKQEMVGTEDLEELFSRFSDALLSWTLEEELVIDSDEWTPVPTTIEGIKSQEVDFIMELIDVWMTAVAGVEAPLPEGSNSGETSQELSLPMEAL